MDAKQVPDEALYTFKHDDDDDDDDDDAALDVAVIT
jgi:hypothetical protein